MKLRLVLKAVKVAFMFFIILFFFRNFYLETQMIDKLSFTKNETIPIKFTVEKTALFATSKTIQSKGFLGNETKKSLYTKNETNMNRITPRNQRKENFEIGKLEFHHIPKTGGTSIEDAAAAAGIRWSRCKYMFTDCGKNISKSPINKFPFNTSADFTRSHATFLNESEIPYFLWKVEYWHMPLHWLKNFPFDANTKTFTVVRNPYDLAISEYYCPWNGAKSSRRNINNWIQRKIVCNEKSDKLKSKIYSAHFLPQYDHIYNKHGKKIIDYVLKFENLDEQFQNLMKKFSLNLNLRKVNTRKVDSELGIANLTNETIAMINEYYKNDFKFFNYSMRNISVSKWSKEELVINEKSCGKFRQRHTWK